MQFKKLIVQSIIWRGLYFLTVLLLNVLIARYFKANGSGWIYYISNQYAFILLIASLSLESGMGFYTARHEISETRLLNFSLVWTSVIGLILFMCWYFHLYKEEGPGMLRGLSLVSSFSYVCGNLLTAYCTAIFYARNNFITPSIICIVGNMLLFCLLLFILTGTLSAFGATSYLYIYFLAFLIQGLVLAFALVSNNRSKWELRLPSFGEFKTLLRYSLTAFVANLVFFLVYRIDYWFVKQFCSADDLGNYIQVSKIGQLLIILPSILASAVFPSVAGGQKEEVNRELKVLSRVILIVIGVPCCFLALTGKWIFPFIFGLTFSHMYTAYLLLIPGILSISALYPVTAYYSGKNMIGINIKGSLVGLVFIVITDMLFIPRFGINAAALMSSLGYMLYHFYLLMFFRREYHTSLSGFFAIRKSDFSKIKNLFYNTLSFNGKNQ